MFVVQESCELRQGGWVVRGLLWTSLGLAAAKQVVSEAQLWAMRVWTGYADAIIHVSIMRTQSANQYIYNIIYNYIHIGGCCELVEHCCLCTLSFCILW